MAESSRFWTTNGTGDGPTGGYTAQQFADLMRKLFGDNADRGVMKGVENELEVTGSSSPLAVDTGAALGYGYYYENTASLNLAVTTPSTGSTGGRVSLEVDWAAQAVRAIVTMNTDGNSNPPALTQSAGSVWEIPLATFVIDVAGNISLTDARQYLQPGIEVSNAMLRNSAALSVLGRASNSAGAPADITAGSDNTVLSRSGTAVGFNALATDMIADGAVTAAKIAADSVDDTKAGDQVPQLYRRQGGSSSDWSSPGSTEYTPGAVRMQAGSVQLSFAGDLTKSATVTFPTAFSNVPLALCMVYSTDTTVYWYSSVSGLSASQVTLTVKASAAATATVYALWLAIGPE